MLALFQSRSFANAAALHATCDAECHEIRAFGLSHPVATFANGVEIPSLELCSRPTSTQRVVSLGRIHPKKALDRLIRAWATIENEFQGWQLGIIGPNENCHADELVRLSKQLGLKRVSISRPVYGAAKNELLARAELFVLPTLNENFALTVAESLACGTPVISTEGAPWSGLVAHRCGWWVQHGVEPLALAMREAMALSAIERSAMGQRGRTWVEREFSWPAIALKAKQTYCWLTDGGKRPAFVHMPNTMGSSSSRGMLSPMSGAPNRTGF